MGMILRWKPSLGNKDIECGMRRKSACWFSLSTIGHISPYWSGTLMRRDRSSKTTWIKIVDQ